VDNGPGLREPAERANRPHHDPSVPREHLDSDEATARVRPGLPLNPAIAQRLQSTVGNRALSAMIAQRRSPSPGAPGSAGRTATAGAGQAVGGQTAVAAASTEQATADLEPVPEPAAPVQRLARPDAAASAKFSSLKSDVKGKQKTQAAHPPPASKANAAQAAAKPPADDKQAQGKAANAEKMNAAQPGTFDKAAFIAAVNKAIAEQAPKNLDEADNFGDSGKADAVKGQVQGKVGQGKEQSAKQIETTTKAAPDTSAAKEKPVTPLVQEPTPGNPGAPNPANAVPDKAPAAATDFSAGPAQVDQQMAGAQVTEEQLAKSNEPEFTGALKEKKAGEQHAATAPGEIRAAENQTLTDAKAGAHAAGVQAVAGMRNDKIAANNNVGKGQQGAQSKDEQQRAQVTAKLQTVFDAAQTDVEAILTGLDKKVDDAFSAGEKAARDAFTAEHKRRMDEYKDKRYSGFTGKLKWVKDKFAGLPEEANQIFVTARQGYVTRMQTVISNVADVIGSELNRAKQRIATGRQQLRAEVQKLPAELQAIGKEAAGEFSGKFDELTESVDAKGQELVQTLASKYNEALKSVDAEIEAEKEKNKGLIAKAVDAVKGVIDTILKLKDLLLGVLAKAAQAVMAILKDPIGFLGNLVSAVGAGLKAFMNNIGTHLKKGLIGWLLGAMSGAGLQLPSKFDLRGILMMIASLLGLTWTAIRGRIVQKGVPEQAMGAVEAGVPVVAKLQSEGVAGAYEEIKDQVGDLKENLLGKISEYLIPTVLIAGITWIISLLNPASAFIKACKMIIDIVTFIIERGAQIIEFVNAVLDAVIAIAGGGAGGVPGLIEAALAKSIPVLIGALAAILGIGGIATKVKSFFQALSKPVMKAVDWVVGKIVALGKKIWAKIKPKGKDAKGKDGTTDGASGDKTGTAAWAKKQIAGTRREIPITVDGESHHLKAAGRPDGTLAVTMASVEEPLTDKIERILKELQKSSKPGKVTVKLRDGREKQISQGDMVEHLKRALRNEELLETAVKKWEERMAAMATPPADGIRILQQIIDDGLKDSTPPVAEPPTPVVVIPKGFDHRKVLYEGDGGRYRKAKSMVFARDFPAVYDRIQAILKPCRDAKAKGDQAAHAAALAAARVSLVEMSGGDHPKFPKQALKEFDDTGDVSGTTLRTATLWNADHIAPLSAHWHAVGYNSDDDARLNAVDDLGNMELLAASANLGKKGEYNGTTYDFHGKPPGPGFKTSKTIPSE